MSEKISLDSSEFSLLFFLPYKPRMYIFLWIQFEETKYYLFLCFQVVSLKGQIRLIL